jgi:hypothetical protein
MTTQTVVADYALPLLGATFAGCATFFLFPFIVDLCSASATALGESVSVVHDHFTPLEPLVLETVYPGEPPHFVDCPCCGPLEVHPLFIPAPNRAVLLEIILNGGDAMEFMRDYHARVTECYLNQAAVHGFLERLHHRPRHVGRVAEFVKSLLSFFTPPSR